MLRPFSGLSFASVSLSVFDRESEGEKDRVNKAIEIHRVSTSFQAVASKWGDRPNMTSNVAISWPLSPTVNGLKSPASKTLIKICLLSHSKWHLTRLVIFQLTAKTFSLPCSFFFPSLCRGAGNLGASFPWTQGYNLKTKRLGEKKKRVVQSFYASVSSFTRAAEAKCFAIIIQRIYPLSNSNHNDYSKQNL